MKTLRKNLDLDIHTIAVLQIEATLNGYGSLKPYMEKLLTDKALKSIKERPKIYAGIAENKAMKLNTRKGLKRRV